MTAEIHGADDEFAIGAAVFPRGRLQCRTGVHTGPTYVDTKSKAGTFCIASSGGCTVHRPTELALIQHFVLKPCEKSLESTLRSNTCMDVSSRSVGTVADVSKLHHQAEIALFALGGTASAGLGEPLPFRVDTPIESILTKQLTP